MFKAFDPHLKELSSGLSRSSAADPRRAPPLPSPSPPPRPWFCWCSSIAEQHQRPLIKSRGLGGPPAQSCPNYPLKSYSKVLPCQLFSMLAGPCADGVISTGGTCARTAEGEGSAAAAALRRGFCRIERLDGAEQGGGRPVLTDPKLSFPPSEWRWSQDNQRVQRWFHLIQIMWFHSEEPSSLF